MGGFFNVVISDKQYCIYVYLIIYIFFFFLTLLLSALVL